MGLEPPTAGSPVSPASPAPTAAKERGHGSSPHGEGATAARGAAANEVEVPGLGLGFSAGVGGSREPRHLSTDLGNLMVSDPSPVTGLAESAESSPATLDQHGLALGAAAVQHLISELFSLPSTAVKDGRLAQLPAPVTPLPREKPIPKPRPPTKWEKFAQAKGIKKRKRSKLEFDEGEGEWRRRHGYKRVNDESEIPILEAKATDEVGVDAFAKREEEKKARGKKNEKNRLANLKQAAKSQGQGPGRSIPVPIPPSTPLPSTLALSASSLPLMPADPQPGARPHKPSKEEFAEAASLAQTATASMGKFDRKLKGAKAPKKTPKALKVLPVAEPGSGGSSRAAKKLKKAGGAAAAAPTSGVERQFMQSLADAVIAKNDTGTLDVGKAISMLNKENNGKKAGRREKDGKSRKGGKEKAKGKGKKRSKAAY